MWNTEIQSFIISKLLHGIIPLLFLWVVYYFFAGSIYGPVQLFSRLFFGKREIKNEKFKKYQEERCDVEIFNITNHLRAQSITHVNQYIDWHNKTGLAIACLRRAGSYFDHEKMELKYKPSSFKNIATMLSIFLIVIFLAIVGCIGGNNEVLASMHTSGKYFWYSEKGAHGFWPNSWHVTTDSNVCTSSLQNPSTTGMTINEVKSLCSFVSKTDLTQNIKKELSIQRNSGIFIGIELVIVLIPLFLALLSMEAARKIYRIESKTSKKQ